MRLGLHGAVHGPGASARRKVGVSNIDPDMHADPEQRRDISTMVVKEALASWKGKAVKAPMDEEIRILLANGMWELSQIDEALYFKGIDNGVVCRVLGYGNDFLAASNSLAMLKELCELLESAFDMHEISPVKKYPGLEIVRDRHARKLWYHRQSYVDKLCRRFIDDEPTGRRPKTACEVDRCLAYFADMRDPAMEFGGRPETLRLVGYADANGASDKQTHSSTNGYVLAFGCAVVFWTSQHIKCATLSSTGSEYIVATKADKEAHRLRFLLAEFQLFDAGMPTILNMDSHLAIADAEGLELRDSLKHMERRYVCLQHMVKRKKIVLHYIPSTK
ncbi:unnamed protein product [Closterium sp. NIES-53]